MYFPTLPHLVCNIHHKNTSKWSHKRRKIIWILVYHISNLTDELLQSMTDLYTFGILICWGKGREGTNIESIEYSDMTFSEWLYKLIRLWFCLSWENWIKRWTPEGFWGVLNTIPISVTKGGIRGVKGDMCQTKIKNFLHSVQTLCIFLCWMLLA